MTSIIISCIIGVPLLVWSFWTMTFGGADKPQDGGVTMTSYDPALFL